MAISLINTETTKVSASYSSGAGSGSLISAERIGNMVTVSGKIVYSSNQVQISGLPDRIPALQDGFALTGRDQNNGNMIRIWTNGARDILFVDQPTNGHPVGFSYSYICV